MAGTRKKFRRSRTENLFVYGSLQPGGPNEHVLGEIRGQWSRATVKGFLKENGWGAGLGYPGLVLDESGDSISGHVLSSAYLSEHWEKLDQFEGSEYQRVRAIVTLESGEVIDAHIYVLQDT